MDCMTASLRKFFYKFKNKTKIDAQYIHNVFCVKVIHILFLLTDTNIL